MSIIRANPGATPIAVASQEMTGQSLLTYDALGLGSIRIQVQGTWVGTIYFELLVRNGADIWDPLAVIPFSQIQSGGVASGVTFTTVNDQFVTTSSGYDQIRVRTNLSSGVAHVSMIGASGISVVAVSNFPTTPIVVNSLTDAQLRATPVPVSATIDTTGLATSVKQDSGNSSLASIDGKLTNPLPVSLASVPSHAVTNAGTFAVQVTSVPTTPVTGTFFQSTQPVSIATMPSTPVTGAFFQATQPVSLAVAPTTPVTGTFFQATQPISATVSAMPAATLGVTATAAAGSAVTLTLPAVAGQFHYITMIEIVKYAAAATTGGATPTIVTSTNLPGSPAWTFATAQAVGTLDGNINELPGMPLRSAVVNTATTIVCPATTNIIWRVNVFYVAAV